ncbi:MAG: NAD(P)H-hydrate dehydratase [Chthoniobacterales bacterium]
MENVITDQASHPASSVVTSKQMRAAEEAAFAGGITAEALMDQAATGIAGVVEKFFPKNPGHCVVFSGKGNNAGDAFAAARLLQERGWTIELHLAFPEGKCGELARKKLRSLDQSISESPHRHSVILDGLLGLGAKLPLRDPIASACREINRRRLEENAFVFAIDIPTGLDGDSGAADADCVIADFNLTIGFAKRGLVVDQALDFVGRIERIPLPDLDPPEQSNAVLADGSALSGLLPRRKFGAYKNQFGRVGVVSGSRGFSGAAILSATGALRGGAGLVELFVLEEIYSIVAATAPPEVMVKPISSYSALLAEPIDVWAVGPGLGQEHANEIRRLIQEAQQPMVVDADALNALARDPSILSQGKGPRLLTPHPGEMKRLFPAEEKSRAEQALEFTAKYPVTLLLKGSRTIVAERDHPLSYNTTGTPGMATGGMGDVLTGVCAALIAQKLSLFDAARLGAWLCGRAAEIAIFNGDSSEESLLPSDLLNHLGRAFRELSF